MTNDHSSTLLATDAGQTPANLKPVVVGSGVWFGVYWRLLRATDGGWWNTKEHGRLTYKLALCRLVSSEGIKVWVIFAGIFKFYCGKKGQKPSTPNASGLPRRESDVAWKMCPHTGVGSADWFGSFFFKPEMSFARSRFFGSAES
jgi:hypothetical protein